MELDDIQRLYLDRNRAFSHEYFYAPGIPADRLGRENGLFLSMGREDLSDLIQGSALSLTDRVLPNGALAESFGEIGGARRYDMLVFARSIGEYVWPACALGRADLAEAALQFMLEHVPLDQIYVPHSFHLDGTLMYNCMQVDAIGHVFYGTYHLWLFTADLSLFIRHKKLFDTWLQTLTWLLVPELDLVHSGNMNEQVDGSTQTMCELSTNATVVYGLRCLAKLMDLADDAANAGRCRNLAERIRGGIERHLKWGDPPMYQVGFWVNDDRTKRNVPDHYFKWLNCFALRALSDTDAGALGATHEELVRRSLADFGRYRIPLGYSPPEFSLLGKYAGWYLGYTARTGRMRELDTMLRFLAEYTVKPRDIWAEAWLLKNCDWAKAPPPGRDHGWVGFADDPDGDYTCDSGNGEQLMLALEHIIREVLGVDLRDGQPGIHPVLPTGWSEVTVDGLVLPDGGGRTARVGYTLRQTPDVTRLEVTHMPSWAVAVSLAAPAGARQQLLVDGAPTVPDRVEHGCQNLRYHVRTSGKSRVCLELTESATSAGSRPFWGA